jgi:two-component system chemotaxis response regulator CheY
VEKKIILVVDDAEVIRTQVSDLLTPQGFQVIEADDGIAGINAYESNPDIQLIVSDVNMPNMDGLTMCEQLKKKPGFSIPILMLTTEASRAMKDEGKRIGVRGWMLKPFDPANFIKIIQMLTENSSGVKKTA